MESAVKVPPMLKSFLKASKIQKNDGKMMGKDGNILRHVRHIYGEATSQPMNEKGEEVMEECLQSLGDGFLSAMNEDEHVVSHDELNVNKQSGWEDPKVHAMKVS
nr:hypothetical protein [Tanacetum cinerariifolium]